MNKDKILADALKQFQESMEIAQKKLMEDFQTLLNRAAKDAEDKLRKREEKEINSLEKELENI